MCAYRFVCVQLCAVVQLWFRSHFGSSQDGCVAAPLLTAHMGGTRALLTIKLPDGKVAYYNDRKLAEQASLSLTVVDPVVHDGKTATPLGFPPDEIMQRLAVIETGFADAA